MSRIGRFANIDALNMLFGAQGEMAHPIDVSPEAHFTFPLWAPSAFYNRFSTSPLPGQPEPGVMVNFGVSGGAGVATSDFAAPAAMEVQQYIVIGVTHSDPVNRTLRIALLFGGAELVLAQTAAAVAAGVMLSFFPPRPLLIGGDLGIQMRCGADAIAAGQAVFRWRYGQVLKAGQPAL